ncbi:MAG: hypothetical protein C0618_10395 [Desulfuromonas sp.]|mgnify:CR=1 FL=1|nr:MAG: hypothetical protein C0618_10395 [Desulfuromonas sp.]
MTKPSFHRRHPLLSILLTLCGCVLVTASIFVSLIELEDVKNRLERELTLALDRPVTIGALNIAYQHGLAIDLQNFHIGQSDSFDIHIPHLTATLSLTHLWTGELHFSEVTLNRPTGMFPARKYSGKAPDHSSLDTASTLLEKFGIGLFSVKEAQITWSTRPGTAATLPTGIDRFNMVLRNWQGSKRGYLVMSGQFADQAGDLLVETHIPAPKQIANWRMQPLTGQIQLKNLTGKIFPEAIHVTAPRVDIGIELEGIPSNGAQLAISIVDSAEKRLRFQGKGDWKSTSQQDSLTNLTVSVLEQPLEGHLSVTHAPDAHKIDGQLSGHNLDLTALLSRLNLPYLQPLESLRGAIISGTLQAHFPRQQENPAQIHYSLQGQFDEGRWQLTKHTALEQLGFHLDLNSTGLTLTGGTVNLGNQQAAFSGQLSDWRDAPEFSLNLQTQPDTHALSEELHENLPEHLQLFGQAPITMALQGSTENIRGQLTVDMEQTSVQLLPLLDKRAKVPATLRVESTWQPGTLTLNQMQLQIGKGQLDASGTVSLPTGKLTNFSLAQTDLSALRPHSPLLQRLRARGSVAVTLSHQTALQGEIVLNKAGAYLTWVIAELNNVNGAIAFDAQGLSFNALQVDLGRSPVRVDGALHNWKDFFLELRVRGENVRARDLVFTNPEAQIQKIDGRLLINKGGIFFDPVQVELPNGTDATVSGYVRNFSAPETFLAIDSFEHADVLEVIDLFVGPPRDKPQRNNRSKTKKTKPIRVTARVAKGSLGGLNFHHAEGEISQHRGLFTLSPLRFRHQQGYCLARVEKEGKRLKISGHLEDFDAGALYQETLKSRGLITGRLRGDFYLEGDGIGEPFWASSQGGAHLEVYDGALRKFRGLARVLSLLNVSQLFKLKLPDMDRKGMPFNRLTTSTTLNNGVLNTENLNIHSDVMNMTLFGQRDIVNNRVDVTVGVKPLQTVDKIVTGIPVAGWLLAGEEKALLTAHFEITGNADNPQVTPVPATSLSKTAIGLLKRTLKLPGTLISDPQKVFFPSQKEDNPTPRTVEKVPSAEKTESAEQD